MKSALDELKNEEDEVEYEIPVYLSKSLNGNLHVYQYPVRPSSHTYDDESVLKVQIKPECCQVEMEIALQTRGLTFDRSKAEQIALNVDGAAGNVKDPNFNFYKSNVMDKLVLNSSTVLTDASRYAIAVMGDNALHLTPLTSVISLRPSFDYLDKADKRSVHDDKDNSDDSDSESKTRKVTVHFERPETERSKFYKERSYSHMRKKMMAESWIPLEYHKLNSNASQFEFRKLFCSYPNEIVDQFHLDESTYLQQLVPKPVGKDVSNRVLPIHMLSYAELSALPLLERLRAIMCNTCVASFHEILSAVKSKKKGNEDSQSVLKVLQQVAVLVQGNWAAKSDIIYAKENVQESGVSNEAMQRARDYALYLFTQKPRIKRVDISNVLDLPMTEVLNILRKIANPTEGEWELLIPPDDKFIKKYTDVAQRQEMIWQSRFEQLSHFIGKMNDKKSISDILRSPKSQRRNSNLNRSGFNTL